MPSALSVKLMHTCSRARALPWGEMIHVCRGLAWLAWLRSCMLQPQRLQPSHLRWAAALPSAQAFLSSFSIHGTDNPCSHA